MKIGLITDTHIGPPAELISNAESEAFLEHFVAELMPGYGPDVIVHLGDHIQHSHDGSDYKTFERVIDAFAGASVPVLNAIGNHDQVTLSEVQLQKLIHRESLYYSVDIAEHHLIVLFSKTSEPGTFVPAHISAEQLRWLETDLAATSLPTIIVTHYSLEAQNLKGNVWFEPRPKCALISNRHEVLDILATSKKVRAILNGHLHRNGFTVERGIPAFTMQAVVEFRNVPVPGQPALAWGTFEIDDKQCRLDVHGNDTATFLHEYNDR